MPTTGNLHWAMDSGLSQQFSAAERAKLWISVGVGATGIAVAEDRVIVAGDDLAAQFPPSPESTEFYERTGFRSMIAAPITGDAGPLGVLEVYSRQPAAFDDDDSGLVGALAGQAAIAITNARLIDQLARSRGELARTAESERTLREIAGRVSAMRNQDEILQSVIDAAVRLLGATGAMIDLLGETGMAEAWTSQEAGIRAISNMGLIGEITLDPDAGGLRLEPSARGRSNGPATTWPTTGSSTRPNATRSFARVGIHSVIAVPLIHREVVVGAITVYGDRHDAFGEEDAGSCRPWPTRPRSRSRNARLIDELERSTGGRGQTCRHRAGAARDHRPDRCAARPGRDPATASSRRLVACSAPTGPT